MQLSSLLVLAVSAPANAAVPNFPMWGFTSIPTPKNPTPTHPTSTPKATPTGTNNTVPVGATEVPKGWETIISLQKTEENKCVITLATERCNSPSEPFGSVQGDFCTFHNNGRGQNDEWIQFETCGGWQSVYRLKEERTNTGTHTVGELIILPLNGASQKDWSKRHAFEMTPHFNCALGLKPDSKVVFDRQGSNGQNSHWAGVHYSPECTIVM